ncbi:MAG: hypothetical protein KIT09_25350 [Bryobacteraceae bacterium]|nr:hypothetical protein [Bryobacteraceae bacterium]
MPSVKSAPPALQEGLKHLRDELYKLHEAMHEAEQSAVATELELVQAASARESVDAQYHDPSSGWLRELLALVARFDAALGSSLSREDGAGLIDETRALVLPEEAGLPGERRPMAKLTGDSGVSAAYNRILELLGGLERYRQ